MSYPPQGQGPWNQHPQQPYPDYGQQAAPAPQGPPQGPQGPHHGPYGPGYPHQHPGSRFVNPDASYGPAHPGHSGPDGRPYRESDPRDVEFVGRPGDVAFARPDPQAPAERPNNSTQEAAADEGGQEPQKERFARWTKKKIGALAVGAAAFVGGGVVAGAEFAVHLHESSQSDQLFNGSSGMPDGPEKNQIQSDAVTHSEKAAAAAEVAAGAGTIALGGLAMDGAIVTLTMLGAGRRRWTAGGGVKGRWNKALDKAADKRINKQAAKTEEPNEE